jgi:hypothetical protein
VCVCVVQLSKRKLALNNMFSEGTSSSASVPEPEVGGWTDVVVFIFFNNISLGIEYGGGRRWVCLCVASVTRVLRRRRVCLCVALIKDTSYSASYTYLFIYVLLPP